MAYRDSFDKCPRCGVALENAGAVRACTACRGQWVLEPVLAEMVIAMLPPGMFGQLTLVPSAARGELACPSCGMAMESASMYGVALERCAKGHGVWFDPAELEVGLRHAADPARHDESPGAAEPKKKEQVVARMPTRTTRELQRLLIKTQRGNIGGGYDLWERQGAQHASPDERARMEAAARETMRQGDNARAALLALIAASEKEELLAWVGAHEAYLGEYLDELAAEGKAQTIEAEFATRSLGEWRNVRAGKLPFADVYEEMEPVRYRRYFGIDPETLEDVS